MKKPNKEAIEVSKYIHHFLSEYAPIHLTGSQHTIKSYKTALSLYITFIEKNTEITSATLKFDCFGKVNIESWIEWLSHDRKCSVATINVRIASLRTFLKYVGSRDTSLLYLYQEVCGIPSKKAIRKKVMGLSKDAVKIILAAPDISTKSGRRDVSFMVLLYSTAARLDELLDMKVKQLHLKSKKPYASVVGKGGKIRTLYLLPKTVAHMEQYMKEFHGDTPEQEAYIFYSRNTGKYGKMSQTAIDKFLKKYARQCHITCLDVPMNLHAHNFRHAKSSHWLEDGMNIVQISFLLGHENLQTTMIYLDITTDQVAEALVTIENETDKMVTPKWKGNDGSLLNFCGLTL